VSALHPRPPAGWVPRSGCTGACLPAAGAGPRWRVARRLTALVVVLVGAVVGGLLLPARARRAWVAACCRAVLAAAGVRLAVRGDRRFAAAGGALVVANHLSWVEVLALGAVQPVRMLAKREVRGWPVVGALAARTGTLFVDRHGLRALPATIADTADALRAGDVVVAFPEGTTWCGSAAGPFRRAAFQAAVDAGAPVRPVAIRLLDAGGARAAGAVFVGEQTLLDAVARVLRAPRLVCEVTVLPAVVPGPASTRRELARAAGEAVGAVTGVAHPVQWPSAPPAAAVTREASVAA
jgi:1-acyl-sn-glycerol-3-phosphate acyltransferase